MSHPPSAERPNLGELREQLAALQESIATLMFYEHGRDQEGHGCSCGWKVDLTNSRVYEWQYRLHLSAAILKHILPTIEQRERHLSAQLEHDRSQVADGVTAIKKSLTSRHWLTEGRGSYSYDDDKWHDEFAAAIVEIDSALEPLARIAGDWKNCPVDGESIRKARQTIEQRERESRLDEHCRICPNCACCNSCRAACPRHIELKSQPKEGGK